MPETTVLVSVSVEELRQIISDVVGACVHSALQSLQQQQPGADSNALLSREETADLLRVSATTLNVWEKEGVLRPVRIGRRVLYRRGSVDEALERVASMPGRRRR